MSPKVTVLVPVYNGTAYLREAIDSVLAQTFDDFELLLIDDCSIDGSAELIGSYRDDRIRFLANDVNLGQIRTLNRGLREALGEYVARLDQDDVALPRRLERQVALLDTESAVCVAGTWMDFVDDTGHVVWELRDRLDDFCDSIYLALIDRLPLAHPTVMFRKAPVLELGGYDEAVRLAEDQDLWRRLALSRLEARVLPELLVRYRVHAGQQSQQSFALQQEHSAMALERFVAELSTGAPAHAVRLLLSGDDAFWREASPTLVRETCAALDRLPSDAAGRLDLSPAEQAKLERLLRSRVYLVVRRSWRAGLTAHWRKARLLRPFGNSGATPRARLAGSLVFVASPLFWPLYVVKRAIRKAVWMRAGFQPVKRVLKRNSAARRIYRVFGGGGA